ncbi:MAG: zf-HC2 domain-containing protein [Planctomycetes bacterium]|nr:zf-HC2 domain-containing protein [Planctomycetota bacterium]
MRCEERGPDLLARAHASALLRDDRNSSLPRREPHHERAVTDSSVRAGSGAESLAIGGPTPERSPSTSPGTDAARELEDHLAACDVCRAEAARLASDVAALAKASAQSAPAAPSAALRARLLAAVRDEAAERRADAAVADAKSCPSIREDLPGLVLGELDAIDRVRVASHLATCPPCAEERLAADRLIAATRAVLVVSAPPADVRARVLASVRAERAADAQLPAAPAPVRLLETRRARIRIRRLSLLVPIAAAASLLAGIVLGSPAVGLHVQDDVGAIFVPCRTRADTAPTRTVDRSAGELFLAEGDGVRAGAQAVDVRLRLGGRAAADPGAEPGTGEVRVRLQPGTLLRRVGDNDFELDSGRVSVHAGRLEARLTLRHGATYAAIVGTQFDASVVGNRLVVSVTDGQVAVGRLAPAGGTTSGGRGPAVESIIGPGTDALVDGTRLLTRRADGSPAADAFLAPQIALTAPATSFAHGSPVRLDAELRTGPAGPVTVSAFDDSDPRVLIRLKGPDGRTLEAKVQRSMLADDLPETPTVRLEESRPYRLKLRLDDLSLVPGTWEARVRYQSYGSRTDGSEWHGTAESGPVSFEVTAK